VDVKSKIRDLIQFISPIVKIKEIKEYDSMEEFYNNILTIENKKNKVLINDMTRFLIDHNANIIDFDLEGQGPLLYAIRNYLYTDIETIKMLTPTDKDVFDQMSNYLIKDRKYSSLVIEESIQRLNAVIMEYQKSKVFTPELSQRYKDSIHIIRFLLDRFMYQLLPDDINLKLLIKNKSGQVVSQNYKKTYKYISKLYRVGGRKSKKNKNRSLD
jgi:hypothetical protein